MRPDAVRLLGVDLGGTKVVVAVGDGAGRVLATRRRPTEPCGRPEEDVARIVEDARAVLAEAGIGPRDVARVGLSVPGPLDPERGVLLDPPNLAGFCGAVPVRDWVADALGVPTAIENDANAAALAEWRFGAGRGCRHMVYLTMSTGIGAGIIANGRLYRGRRGAAGEFGHVPIEWGGERCACGGRGCFEAYAGGGAWARHLQATAPETSRMATLAGGRAAVRPEHVVAAACEGDADACAELDRYNGYVARGVSVVAFALAPERIILGTIPTAAGEALCLAPVRERVAALVWPAIAADLEILPSGLGADLPALAGLSVALKGLEGLEGLEDPRDAA